MIMMAVGYLIGMKYFVTRFPVLIGNDGRTTKIVNAVLAVVVNAFAVT